MTNSNSAGGVLLIIFSVVGLVVGLSALNGFILSYMWEWFVVPLGVRPISLLHAVGISILVALLTKQPEDDRNDGKGFERLFTNIGVRLLGFGIAFIVASLMA